MLLQKLVLLLAGLVGRYLPIQVALLGFAKSRQYAAAVTALATLCDASVDMIKRMLEDGRNEPLLIPCKVANVSWPTLRALLQDEVLGRTASDDELIKIANLMQKVSVEPGGVIFKKGAPGDALYLVREGQVEVLSPHSPDPAEGDDSEDVVAVLGEGALFGEMAMVEGEPANAPVLVDEKPGDCDEPYAP